MHNIVGVIPAAGEARRMRPYSLAVPKQLMPYGHKPVIHHILEMFRESGVNQTVIIVSDTTSPIRTYVGDGSWLGVEVSYAIQREPLGVAHALICGYDVLTQDLEAEAIVHVNGDRVVSPASILQDLIGDHSQQDALSTFLVSRISDPSSYGVLEVDSRTMRVHRIGEKPTQAQQQGLELPDGGSWRPQECMCTAFTCWSSSLK